ncbi:hypothetical protein Q3G72_034205 [Acer saccharum]|nr:hypothetical protein Q3G72_034205 [Acer saccharum]
MSQVLESLEKLEQVDEASLSHGGNANHVGQISSWFEATELGMEPIPDAAGPSIGGNIEPGGKFPVDSIISLSFPT